MKYVTRKLQDGERFGTPSKPHVCIQRERCFVVKTGVNHCNRRAAALHPTQRVSDESTTNSPTTQLRIDCEPLEVAKDSRLTG
jgi:hypothetical protein